MNVEDIRTLYEYNQWANRRLLATAKLLHTDDFVRDLGSDPGTVRGTLAHILGGEWIWLQLWLGGSSQQIIARRDALWKPERFPDVAALESSYNSLVHDQDLFLQGLIDELLKTRIGFENSQGQPCEFSLVHMMQHVVNHSSYHRGQAVLLLRQLGQAPPDTDFTMYLRERSA